MQSPNPHQTTIIAWLIVAAALLGACTDNGYSAANTSTTDGASETTGGGSGTSGTTSTSGTSGGTTGGTSATSTTTDMTTPTTTGATTGTTNTTPTEEPRCLEVIGVEDGDAEVTGPMELGTVPLASGVSRALTLLNCSERREITIASIQLAEGSEAFSVDSPEPSDAPFTLAPGDAMGVTLTFAPTEVRRYEGRLEIAAGDSAEVTRAVPLIGHGDGPCEVQSTGEARARLDSDDGAWATTLSVPPLSTLLFDVELEADEAPFSRVEWSVASQPTGSYAIFAPSASAITPQMFLSVVGRYVIEVKTFNDRGVPACETQQIVVTVTPPEGVYVHVTWATPGDDDPNGMGIGQGSDVDLHFLHPRGTWNEPPWDCHWLNTEPDWGDPNSAEDNPQLLIDDADGAGPEALALEIPEEVTYHVGVHYFSDNGLGPSYATVQIYLDGELAYEAIDQELARTDVFWEVVDIDWPNREVVVIDALRDSIRP